MKAFSYCPEPEQIFADSERGQFRQFGFDRPLSREEAEEIACEGCAGDGIGECQAVMLDSPQPEGEVRA